MGTPHATVLMAAYNAADHIDEAILSVLGQTYEDFELLVIDDGSSDDTAERVQAYADARVRLVSRETNSGAAAARNYGMQLAAADLIAILDADDVAYPTRLERQVEYMDSHRNCGLLGSAFDLIGESGVVHGTNRTPCDTAVIRWKLLLGNVIGNSTTMLRKRDALAAGGYDESLRVAEDYALWVAMAPLTDVAQLPEVLAAYREHVGQLSTTDSDQVVSATTVVAQRALSAAAGYDVSLGAVRCLTNASPQRPVRRATYRECVRAMADALDRMIARDETTRGLKLLLLDEWRHRMTQLCSVAPLALPWVLTASVRLSVKVAGLGGLANGYVAWVMRVVRATLQSVLSAFIRSRGV